MTDISANFDCSRGPRPRMFMRSLIWATRPLHLTFGLAEDIDWGWSRGKGQVKAGRGAGCAAMHNSLQYLSSQEVRRGIECRLRVRKVMMKVSGKCQM